MKISLYRKALKCPKCGVPMKFETMEYSDKVKKLIEEEHEKNLEEIRENKFCGSIIFSYDLKIYRCPKCLDLYAVEEEDKK